MIVVGEALVDLTLAAPSGESLALTAHAGGSPANVAVGLARLGVATSFAARLARDGLGPFLRAHLERSGVDLSLAVEATQPATLAIVDLDNAGVASYAFYVEGTADWAWQLAELPANAAGAALHTGSLAIGLEPGAETLVEWVAGQRERGDVFISLDPNVRPTLVLGEPRYRRRLERFVALAHLVKVSEEDLRALEPETEPELVARSWAAAGPELVVVTRGPHGATAFPRAGEAVDCPAVPVEVLDTIGAGDAFTSGLLAFLAEHGALEVGACASLERTELLAALGFAAQVAALTCARAGADPPSRAELAAAAELRSRLAS